MFNRERSFIIYEKPEASDPAERVMLVRDGFYFWAFFFGLIWLLRMRQWLASALYMTAIASFFLLADAWRLGELHLMLAQFWLQCMLGLHAGDIKGWQLKRRGYRFAGVLMAENEMKAERRYYEFAS